MKYHIVFKIVQTIFLIALAFGADAEGLKLKAENFLPEILGVFTSQMRYDVKMIVDSPAKFEKVLAGLPKLPVEVLTAEQTGTHFPKASCSQNVPIMDRPLKLNPTLLLTYVEGPDQVEMTRTVMRSLKQTLALCSNHVEPGHFHSDNLLIFVHSGPEDTVGLDDLVFSDKEVQRHQHVATLRWNERGTIFFRRYNIYEAKTVTTMWDIDVLPDDTTSAFFNFDMKVRSMGKSSTTSSSIAKLIPLHSLRASPYVLVLCHGMTMSRQTTILTGRPTSSLRTTPGTT